MPIALMKSSIIQALRPSVPSVRLLDNLALQITSIVQRPREVRLT